MSRTRSVKQKTIDERSFPARVLFEIPAMGLSTRLDDIYAWIDANGGRRMITEHVHEGKMAIYFRRPEDWPRFCEAFPDVQMSDRVDDEAYTCWAKGPRGWNDVPEPPSGHTAGVSTRPR